MQISTIFGRVLQSMEFLRFNVGSYFVGFWRASILSRIFIVGSFIWGCIRFTISLFGTLCTAIRTAFGEVHVSGIQAGGVDVLAFANSVLPLDEMIALLVTWFSLHLACTTIRFFRAAWAAIPLKAT